MYLHIYSIYMKIILKYIHPCICIYIILHSIHTYIMFTQTFILDAINFCTVLIYICNIFKEFSITHIIPVPEALVGNDARLSVILL